MNCGSMRLNFEKSAPDAGCCRPNAKMRDPMDRSRRLTDGTRWMFMRLLQLDSLMTSYTPDNGLLVPLPRATRTKLASDGWAPDLFRRVVAGHLVVSRPG